MVVWVVKILKAYTIPHLSQLLNTVSHQREPCGLFPIDYVCFHPIDLVPALTLLCIYQL
jgi:hypothetical protein